MPQPVYYVQCSLAHKHLRQTQLNSIPPHPLEIKTLYPPLSEEGQFLLIPDKVIVFLCTKYQERVNK